jgi:hypothetical protein
MTGEEAGYAADSPPGRRRKPMERQLMPLDEGRANS